VQRFKTLPDYLQIWPGHGAGSACGKALGAVPSSVLGYEKLFNPALRFEEEDNFVAWLLKGQPEAPRYFAEMKRVNKEGPALLRELAKPAHLNRAALDVLLRNDAQIFDLRSAEDSALAYIRGTLNIPATAANFSSDVGWFVDYRRPLYLILPALAEAPAIIDALRAIGVDNIGGVSGPEVIDDAQSTIPSTSAPELAERLLRNGVVVVDVRGRSEYEQLHIVGARNIPLGYLPQRLHELPHDRPVVVHCASGRRSHIAASLLHAAGFDNVINLDDKIDRWSKLLLVESGQADAHAAVAATAEN
jgi:hydroxyacylglutathione hydrolase